MQITERTEAGLALALASFDAEHGSVLGCALSLYAEEMRKTAAECEGALEPVPAYVRVTARTIAWLLTLPGTIRRLLRGQRTISIRPTASGVRQAAQIFADCADKAGKAAGAYEQIAELADELAAGDEY